MSTAHTLTRRLFAAWLAVLPALAAAPARGVIIQTASGTGNTTALTTSSDLVSPTRERMA